MICKDVKDEKGDEFLVVVGPPRHRAAWRGKRPKTVATALLSRGKKTSGLGQGRCLRTSASPGV